MSKKEYNTKLILKIIFIIITIFCVIGSLIMLGNDPEGNIISEIIFYTGFVVGAIGLASAEQIFKDYKYLKEVKIRLINLIISSFTLFFLIFVINVTKGSQLNLIDYISSLVLAFYLISMAYIFYSILWIIYHLLKLKQQL